VWNESIRIGLARLAEMLRRNEEPPASALQLLAVIPAGASIEETIARLEEIQAEHPGAQVRRGKRNCFETRSAQRPISPKVFTRARCAAPLARAAGAIGMPGLGVDL
jgi:hypothetical protein